MLELVLTIDTVMLTGSVMGIGGGLNRTGLGLRTGDGGGTAPPGARGGDGGGMGVPIGRFGGDGDGGVDPTGGGRGGDVEGAAGVRSVGQQSLEPELNIAYLHWSPVLRAQRSIREAHGGARVMHNDTPEMKLKMKISGCRCWNGSGS